MLRDLLRGALHGPPAQNAVRALLLALALGAGAVVQFGSEPASMRAFETVPRDALTRLLASDAQDPRIAIVDVDEASLQRIGPWPWSRDILADLAERLLSEAAASRVVFDLVLAEPSPDAAVGEARLAALAREGGLVLAQAFDYERRDAVLAVGTVGGEVEGARALPAAQATGHIANFAALSRARCIGNIGFVPDPDGQIRRIAPITEWQGARYPSLSLAAVACGREGPGQAALAAALPVDPGGLWAVPFARWPESFLAVSAADVLRGGLDAGRPGSPGGAPLAGRIVVVGSSALGLADRVATPLSPNVGGVTVHAAAIGGLLDVAAGTAPTPPPRWLMPAWLFGSVLALWWSVAGTGGRIRRAIATLAVVAPGWTALAAWAAATGATTPVSGPLAGYACVLLLQLPIEWSWSQARVRRRTMLLTRYVAPSVLGELLRADRDDPLEPRHARITVLIADMEGYTRMTADSKLEDAARLTKEFLDRLTRPVLEHRGTLDRYTGDGLVAFWGAPVADEDHADRAVEASLAIVDNVARFNAQRARDGLAPVTVRMGLASGSALVGDLGTPFRISYTAVGDCINLASRLQQASRELGVYILAASSVAAQCRRHRLAAIGTIPVKGLPDQAVFTPDAAPDPRPSATDGRVRG